MRFQINKKLLFHEILLIGLLSIIFIRLVVSKGIMTSFAFTIAVMLLGCLWLYLSKERAFHKWLKLGVPVFCVPTLYFYFGQIAVFLEWKKQDALLQKADAFLVGGNLSLKTMSLIHPMVTEVMYVCYMLFFFYIIATLISYLKKAEALRTSFYSGLFTLYWIGFLFYTLIPAVGPCIDMMDTFKSPLDQGIYFAKPIYDFIYQAGNRIDLFPSLHCGISGFCLFFDFQHNRRRFWRYLPLCILIWISTIYLRYHYFVDVIAGFSLAGFALFIARWTLNKGKNLEHDGVILAFLRFQG